MVEACCWRVEVFWDGALRWLTDGRSVRGGRTEPSSKKDTMLDARSGVVTRLRPCFRRNVEKVKTQSSGTSPPTSGLDGEGQTGGWDQGREEGGKNGDGHVAVASSF